ncbi:MAG: hypothetical protein HYW05_03030 [Candidatus Diapherotrites archaeon]|nr:hypothetical protein [Candidatus Diapherotrites archaeon]
MNKAILVLIGLVALLFLAGCIDSGKADQDAAVRLADNTAEAKIAIAFGEFFAGEKTCTIEDAVGIIVANDANVGPEIMAALEGNFEIAKKCFPEVAVAKEAKKTAEREYTISYSFKISEDCESPGITGIEPEEFLIIEADLKDNSTNITKGGFPDEETRQQAAAGIEMMKGQPKCYYLTSIALGMSAP